MLKMRTKTLQPSNLLSANECKIEKKGRTRAFEELTYLVVCKLSTHAPQFCGNSKASLGQVLQNRRRNRL